MEWVVKATPQQLYLRETDPLPTVQKAGWASRPVWTDAKNLAPTDLYRDSMLCLWDIGLKFSYFYSVCPC